MGTREISDLILSDQDKVKSNQPSQQKV